VRFDDTLETVLAGDVSTPFGKASAWRQLVDLIGRGRAHADPRALALLDAIRHEVPVAVRAASSRALELAQPPFTLVRLCATDDIAVAAPVLRSANLRAGEWIELLPRLSAAGRNVVRARRDLPTGVEAALASFAVDFVIEGEVDAKAEPSAMPSGGSSGDLAADSAEVAAQSEEAAPTEPVETEVADTPEPVDAEAIAAPPEDEPSETATPEAPTTSTSTFVSVSAAALSIPVVAAALQHAASDGAGGDAAPVAQSETAEAAPEVAALAPDSPEAHDEPMSGDDLILADRDEAAVADVAPAEPNGAAIDGPFEIADVVARIDAFYTRQQDRGTAAVQRPRGEGFRFETDAQGVIRWVEGVTRAPLIGLSLEIGGVEGGSGVDGAVAGAFRQRAPFSDGRLVVTGDSDAAGDWRISGSPAFDPVTGRFAGHRGTARRPRIEDDAARAPAAGASADTLRQLMHELRTPANAIAGFAEMIERQMLGEVAPVYRGRAAVIRDHARALLAAIEDLDIAARIEASALQLHPGEVALRPLLCRIVEDLGALAEARNASVTLPSDDAIAAADARAVERLVSRLLATLLSAAGEGERVEVSLGAGEDFVSLSATRPRALLAYADEALFAIDDEHEDAALLGTGFALRLLRNLARELSGSLVVEAGALTVRLPASVTKSLEVMR
jgi:signal transduction histidine kinase